MNRHARHFACLIVVVSGLAAGTPVPAAAQSAPTELEIERFDPLHAAAHVGDLDRVRRMLVAGRFANLRDGRGRTPVHVATFAGQRQVIRALVEAGADIDALEHERYDALTIAAVADDEETLRLLLELGADPGQTTSRYDGTALIAAAHLGHDGIVRQLIAAGAPLDHVNNLHWTAVIEAIVLGDGGERHQATLKALIDAGADLSIGDRAGRTPLVLAERLDYVPMVKMLRAGRKQ